jgi:phosphohistidine phosphatase
MPRTLYLLRHADSLEKKTNQIDKDRELSPRGIQQCRLVGECFRERNLKADLICSSSAVRTRSTSELLAAHIGIAKQQIHYTDRLYEASLNHFREVVSQLDDAYSGVVCVGHNPGISYFAEYLCESNIGSMSTGGLAILNFDISTWHQIPDARATSFIYIDPTTN